MKSPTNLLILLLITSTVSCTFQEQKTTSQQVTKTAVAPFVQKETRESNQRQRGESETTYSFGQPAENFDSKRVFDRSEPSSISDVPKFLSTAEIYSRFEKQPEVFRISGSVDTVLYGTEGTQLAIKGNSFVDSNTGEIIQGEIEISLTEYYKTSEILMANLTTKSNDEILETGGMIHLSAATQNKVCELKDGSAIDIGFPYDEEKEGMQLFHGERDEGVINWQLDEPTESIVEVTEATADSQIFFMVEQMPEFPGGLENLMDYLKENIRYPRTALENDVSGRVYITFVVNEKGEIKEPRIIRGIGGGCDEEALRVVSEMPNWIPGKQRGKNVPVRYNLPINFRVYGSTEFTGETSNNNSSQKKRNDKAFARKFEKNASDTIIDSREITRYLFSSPKIGWINCDRFYNSRQEQLDYLVKLKDAEQSDVKMLFHEFRSVLAGSAINNGHKFKNIPSGSKVTLVAVKVKDGQNYLAMDETTISRSGDLNLEFKPVTLELLKSELEKLDQI